jgi:hypothetical protein
MGMEVMEMVEVMVIIALSQFLVSAESAMRQRHGGACEC